MRADQDPGEKQPDDRGQAHSATKRRHAYQDGHANDEFGERWDRLRMRTYQLEKVHKSVSPGLLGLQIRFRGRHEYPAHLSLA
jgi:hypothetical protein